MHPQPAASGHQAEAPSVDRASHCDRYQHRRAAAPVPLRHWIAPQHLPELLTQPRPDLPAAVPR
jgi:hypothetical protein